MKKHTRRLGLILLLLIMTMGCSSPYAEQDRMLEGNWKLIGKTVKFYFNEDAGAPSAYVEQQVEYIHDADEARYRDRGEQDGTFSEWSTMSLGGDSATTEFANNQTTTYMHIRSENKTYVNHSSYEWIDQNTITQQLDTENSEKYDNIDTLLLTINVSHPDDNTLIMHTTVPKEDLAQFEDTKVLSKLEVLLRYVRVECFCSPNLTMPSLRTMTRSSHSCSLVLPQEDEYNAHKKSIEVKWKKHRQTMSFRQDRPS